MAKDETITYLEDIKKDEIENKKVLVRVDFNVPLNEKLQISDDTRIVAALNTIQYLLSHHCSIILMSHLGRPEGQIVDRLKMDPVATHLEDLLKQKILKLDECIGEEIQKAIAELKPGDIVLLENLRFHPEEKKNDPDFSRQLASLADIYINDAFGAAHRAHASTAGVTAYLPSYAGFLMEKEVKCLNRLLSEPEKPFVSIIGGAKVSDKIEVLEKLIEICDALLIGGGMVFTFLAAKGYEVGKSILEKDYIDYVKKLTDSAQKHNKKIIIPTDIVTAREFKASAESFNVPVNAIEKDMFGMDIGESTIELFNKEIEKARTIFWNGPLGVFEMEKFARGTNQIASKIASLGKNVFSVVGGGDSIAALNQFGLADKISHVSTGGGASLEFLSGKKLPGLEALKKK